MNSQVGQSNDKWRDLENPKSYIEKQAHIKWKKCSMYRKMTNYK